MEKELVSHLSVRSLSYPACKASVACPALFYFVTLPRKRQASEKKLLTTKCVFWFYLQIIENKMCVFFFSTNYWTQNVGFDFLYKLLDTKCVFSFSLQITGHKMCFHFLYKLLDTKCVFSFSLQITGHKMCFHFLYKLLNTKCVFSFSLQITGHKMCVFFFSTNYWTRNVCFFIFSTNYWTQNVWFNFLYKLLDTKCVV